MVVNSSKGNTSKCPPSKLPRHQPSRMDHRSISMLVWCSRCTPTYQLMCLVSLLSFCLTFLIVFIILCPECVEIPSDWALRTNPVPIDLGVTVPDHKLVNLHNFEYVINNNICDNQTFLVILVHSAPENEAERTALRTTWAYPTRRLGKSIKTVFLLASRNTTVSQKTMVSENDRYHDIVQGNFIDSYKNLTYKLMMGMKWVTSYCPSAKFVLKADDDVFVDIYRIVDILRGRYRNANRLVLCNVFSEMAPVRDRRSKWYVSESEFPNGQFKPYCSGWAVLMSRDVVRAVDVLSVDMPYFWIDDVMLGILADALRIRLQRFSGRVDYDPFNMARWVHDPWDDSPPSVVAPYRRNPRFLQNLWNKCESFYRKRELQFPEQLGFFKSLKIWLNS